MVLSSDDPRLTLDQAEQGAVQSNNSDQPSQSPLYSVTIEPTGMSKALFEGLIAAFAKASDRQVGSFPHLTIQISYQQLDEEELKRTLAKLTTRTRPVAIQVAGEGVLESPHDPTISHVNLQVKRTPAVLDLYRSVTEAIRLVGGRPYGFSADEWQPHMTIISGKLKPDELEYLVGELADHELDFAFIADGLTLSKRDDTGWAMVAHYEFNKGC